MSEWLFSQVEEMFIDEERLHVLTKYATTKGIQKRSESDHNFLYAKFKIALQNANNKERLEVFNFKNLDCQKLFFAETSNIEQFDEIFLNDLNVEEQSQKLCKKLNSIFQKCFKKIRITGKTNMKDEIVFYMKLKTQLKIDVKNTENGIERNAIENQIRILENYLSLKCSEKNKDLVKGYSEQLNSQNGTFSQHGLWTLKSKLCQKSMDPPMAKVDSNGQLITAPNLLKDLYLRTYCERLSHRVIKTEYEDIFEMKTGLWEMILETCRLVNSEEWKMSEMEKVLKNLKTKETVIQGEDKCIDIQIYDVEQ